MNRIDDKEKYYGCSARYSDGGDIPSVTTAEVFNALADGRLGTISRHIYNLSFFLHYIWWVYVSIFSRVWKGVGAIFLHAVHMACCLFKPTQSSFDSSSSLSIVYLFGCCWTTISALPPTVSTSGFWHESQPFFSWQEIVKRIATYAYRA